MIVMRTLIVATMLVIVPLTLTTCQQPPTVPQVVNGVSVALPIVCTAEQLMINDPTFGAVCLTLEELDKARQLLGSKATMHEICACVLNDIRKDGGNRSD